MPNMKTYFNFKVTAQGYSEYFYSPELCYFTMTSFVRIHISRIIPKRTFHYVITFNSTDKEKRISYTCQFTALVK
jgi:hypothetical protein